MSARLFMISTYYEFYMFTSVKTHDSRVSRKIINVLAHDKMLLPPEKES